MRVRFQKTLEILTDHEVEFIVVGGIAAVLQGAPIITFDLDIVHRRTPENVQRLLSALRVLEARYRGDPRDLVPATSHLLGPGHNLLTTLHGSLDLLGTIGSGWSYDDLIAQCITVELGEDRIQTLELARLIEVKAEAGRAKDLAVLPTLRATLAENEKNRSH